MRSRQPLLCQEKSLLCRFLKHTYKSRFPLQCLFYVWRKAKIIILNKGVKIWCLFITLSVYERKQIRTGQMPSTHILFWVDKINEKLFGFKMPMYHNFYQIYSVCLSLRKSWSVIKDDISCQFLADGRIRAVGFPLYAFLPFFHFFTSVEALK